MKPSEKVVIAYLVSVLVAWSILAWRVYTGKETVDSYFPMTLWVWAAWPFTLPLVGVMAFFGWVGKTGERRRAE